MTEPIIKIFLQCYSQPMRYGDNRTNPKNYPHWLELVSLMKQKENWQLTQIRRSDEIGITHAYVDNTLDQIARRVRDEMDFFVSIDSFLPHMAHYYGKVGFVIWGQSDPELFGYRENFNLLKDRKNLREKQFWQWEQTPYREDVFPTAEEVFEAITTYLP